MLNQVVILLVVVVNQPVLRRISVGLTVFLQKALLNQLLFALSSWPLLPLSGVGLSIHDDSLSLGNNSVIASSNLSRSHLSDGHSDSFSFS